VNQIGLDLAAEHLVVQIDRADFLVAAVQDIKLHADSRNWWIGDLVTW